MVHPQRFALVAEQVAIAEFSNRLLGSSGA